MKIVISPRGVCGRQRLPFIPIGHFNQLLAITHMSHVDTLLIDCIYLQKTLSENKDKSLSIGVPLFWPTLTHSTMLHCVMYQMHPIGLIIANCIA